MKIEKLECWPISFELVEPFRTASDTIQKFDNVILKAITDSGTTGWGCASPDTGFNGETAQSVLNDYAETIEPMLKGCDPFRIAKWHQQLRVKLDNRRSALAMADLLLYDLTAKASGQPLYKLLGGFRDSIVTSVTIGIMPLDATLACAKKCVSDGFSCLKLKGGLNVQLDIEKTRKLREAVGRDVTMRFDGNQGYSVADTMKYIRQTTAANLQFIEQPTRKEMEHQLGEIISKTEMPIMVDESLVKLTDAFYLAKNRLADLMNIKLMRVGGITEATHINAVARSAAIHCMVGCLDECELGIAFGLHFCLSRPNLMYADLDGALDIRQDPFRGLITIDKGLMHPSTEPGIGHPCLEG